MNLRYNAEIPPIYSSSQTNGKKRECQLLLSKFYPFPLILYSPTEKPGDFIRLEPYETAISVSLKYSNFSNVFCFIRNGF